jgi:hypothetical protein
MASKILEFSFAKVGYELGYFPIGCRCCISSIELGIYLAKLEWLLEILNFICKG